MLYRFPVIFSMFLYWAPQTNSRRLSIWSTEHSKRILLRKICTRNIESEISAPLRVTPSTSDLRRDGEYVPSRTRFPYEPVLKYRDTQLFHYKSTTSTPKSAINALLQQQISAETYCLTHSAAILTQAHTSCPCCFCVRPRG